MPSNPETVNHYINANIRYKKHTFYIVTNSTDVKPIFVRFLYYKRDFNRICNGAHMMCALRSHVINTDKISEIQIDGVLTRRAILTVKQFVTPYMQKRPSASASTDLKTPQQLFAQIRSVLINDAIVTANIKMNAVPAVKVVFFAS